jgi:hypothetical protein
MAAQLYDYPEYFPPKPLPPNILSKDLRRNIFHLNVSGGVIYGIIFNISHLPNIFKDFLLKSRSFYFLQTVMPVGSEAGTGDDHGVGAMGQRLQASRGQQRVAEQIGQLPSYRKTHFANQTNWLYTEART